MHQSQKKKKNINLKYKTLATGTHLSQNFGSLISRCNTFNYCWDINPSTAARRAYEGRVGAGVG